MLMMKRPAGVTWENMWEFPVLPAVTKSKRNKIATGPLGMTLTSPRPCNNVVHTLTHRRMIYDVFSATWKKGAPALPPCPEGGAYTEFRWVEWPLAKHRGMAFGRVVERIAQVVSDS